MWLYERGGKRLKLDDHGVAAGGFTTDGKFAIWMSEGPAAGVITTCASSNGGSPFKLDEPVESRATAGGSRIAYLTTPEPLPDAGSPLPSLPEADRLMLLDLGSPEGAMEIAGGVGKPGVPHPFLITEAKDHLVYNKVRGDSPGIYSVSLP